MHSDAAWYRPIIDCIALTELRIQCEHQWGVQKFTSDADQNSKTKNFVEHVQQRLSPFGYFVDNNVFKIICCTNSLCWEEHFMEIGTNWPPNKHINLVFAGRACARMRAYGCSDCLSRLSVFVTLRAWLCVSLFGFVSIVVVCLWPC